MATQIQLRRDTEANWLQFDPVLADGEPGYDKTNHLFKVGNGVDPWSALRPLGEGGGTGTGGIEEAPLDGAQYARQSGAWEPVATPLNLAFEFDKDPIKSDSTGKLHLTELGELMLPERDRNGVLVTPFLDLVKIGTNLLVSRASDRRDWWALAITAEAQLDDWGSSLMVEKIAEGGGISDKDKVELQVIAAAPEVSSSVVTELRKQLEHEREQRRVLEFQLRSVFSVMSKTAQNKLRGVFPEGGNDPDQEWNGGDY